MFIPEEIVSAVCPTRYIHCGVPQEKFDRNLIEPVRNWKCRNKPRGGFWASRVDAEWGWRDWCESESYNSGESKGSTIFHLRKGSKVYRIDSVDDIKSLYDEFCILSDDPIFNMIDIFCGMATLDFEKMLSVGWDGIEIVHMTSDIYSGLYGWDCESILILNPEIIEVDEFDLEFSATL